jgi:hypothetical protein
LGDSPRKSSVTVEVHEQPHSPELHDNELAHI